MVEGPLERAEVAELADASVSKTDVRKDVRVRLPVSAPRGCNGGSRLAGYGEGTMPGIKYASIIATIPTRLVRMRL